MVDRALGMSVFEYGKSMLVVYRSQINLDKQLYMEVAPSLQSHTATES